MKNKSQILITGGARRIGAVISQFFAEQKWSVVIHANSSQKEAIELVKSLTDKGFSAHVAKADLSDHREAKALIPSLVEAYGHFDALINNASTFNILSDTVEKFDYDLWMNHMNVNAMAPAMLSQEFAKQLPKDMQGNIINIIDQRVFNLTPSFTTYTLSKSALWTMTKTFAMALAPNIRVNGIGPGPTYPDAYLSEENFNKQVASTPLQKKTDPLDIAKTALHIINTPSITGQMLALDGGQHLG